MAEIRNILLVGRTGSGKSALANVLVNKNGNFKEVFRESPGCASETINIQSEEIEHEGIRYRIIDTIGMGDTKLSDVEVLYRMVETYYESKEGLTQVLFVICDRITQEERKIYNTIKKFVLGDGVSEYTTIIRTRFSSFRNPERCKKDVEEVKKGNDKTAKLINSCREVIHVDNPSLNPKDFDEEEIISNRRRREVSRNTLLNYLKNCQNVPYLPTNLDFIGKEFKEEMSEIEQLKRKISNDDLREEEKIELERRLEEIREKITQRLEKECEKVKKSTFKIKNVLKAAVRASRVAKNCTQVVGAFIEVTDHCNQM